MVLFGVSTQAIFTEPMKNESTFSGLEVRRSPYTTKVAMKGAATEMHEIGHSFDLGRADDEFRYELLFRNFEIYSGQTGGFDDDTPEEINNEITWSLMAKLDCDLAMKPMDGRYFVFSIEELSTIEEP